MLKKCHIKTISQVQRFIIDDKTNNYILKLPNPIPSNAIQISSSLDFPYIHTGAARGEAQNSKCTQEQRRTETKKAEFLISFLARTYNGIPRNLIPLLTRARASYSD